MVKRIVTGIWDIVQGWSRPARVALEWVWLIAVSNPCSPTVAKGNSSCSSRAAGRTRGQCIGGAGCNQHALSWPIQPGDTAQRRPQPRKPGTMEASDGVTLAILPPSWVPGAASAIYTVPHLQITPQTV